VRRRRDDAEDGCAVGGGAGGDGNHRTTGQRDLGEANDGNVKRGEVGVEAGAQAAVAVRAKLDDRAGDDGVCGEKELVVGEDG